MTHTGPARVSTPAPELVVIDFFTQHAIQPQHQLASDRNYSHGRVLAALDPKIETSQGLIFADRRVRRFDQQEPQQPVALLGDVAETLAIAAGMLLGIQTAVGRHAAGTIEALDRIQCVHHRQPAQHSHAAMRPQAHNACILLRSPPAAGRTAVSHGGLRPPTDGLALPSAGGTTASSQTLPRPRPLEPRTAHRTSAGRLVHGRAGAPAVPRSSCHTNTPSACEHANPLRCTLSSAPPDSTDAKRFRARVSTLAPGGACLMSSV